MTTWLMLAAVMGLCGLLGWLWRRGRRRSGRVNAEVAALRQTASLFQVLTDNAGDMIVRARPDRTRAYVSPACRTLLRFSPEELRNTDFITFVHPDDRSRVEAEYEDFVRSGGRRVCSYRLRRSDGTFVWVEVTWVSQPAETGKGHDVIGVARDVSEWKEAQARIAFLSRHDPLTGLANRALLAERAEAALARQREPGCVALLCLGIDGVRAVRDTLGHRIGDMLLGELAGRFTGNCGAGATVARLSDLGFAVLLAELDQPEQAMAVARKIVAAVARLFVVDRQEIMLDIRVGIAVAPADASAFEELLRRAEAALERAREEGRSAVRFFEPGMDAGRLRRQQLELELRGALAERRFTVVYQPLVSLSSGHVTGFEALLRWQSEQGPVPPSDFIPIAEETGLIVPIGAWVLEQACWDAGRWPEKVTVAVNLSPVQLRAPGLVRTVFAALDRSGLAAERLELEITESVLLESDDGALAALTALHERGVRIALDDFGTGYSSLRYLRSFPFDKIKLDRSFVADLLREEGAVAIVRAVASLGRSLGISTLAEGVESRHQADCLRAEGYIEAQGYFFSRPAPFEQTAGLLERLGVQPALAAEVG